MTKPTARDIALKKLAENPRFREAPKTGTGFIVGAQRPGAEDSGGAGDVEISLEMDRQVQPGDPPYLAQLLADYPTLTREKALRQIREADGWNDEHDP